MPVLIEREQSESRADRTSFVLAQPHTAGSVSLSSRDVILTEPSRKVYYLDTTERSPNVYHLSAQDRVANASLTEQSRPATEWVSTLRDVVTRIQRLLQLQPGWDSYGASRLDPVAASRATELVTRLLALGAPPPAIAPGSRGSVHLEWYLDPRYVEISVLPGNRIEVFYEDETEGIEWEKALDAEFNLRDVARLLDTPK